MAKKTKAEEARTSKIAEFYRQDLTMARAAAAPTPQAEAPAEPQMEAGEAATNMHTPVASGGQEVGIAGAQDPEFGEAGAPDSANDFEVDVSGAAAAEGGMEMAAAGAEVAAEDEEFLLDVWHASYSDPATLAMLREQKQKPSEVFLEVVIGSDDRRQVNITDKYPWRAIASLLITASDGSRWIGTGWFISPRTLITAGHCVYIHSRGGWARRIEVIPGRNAAERPYGSCMATDLRSVIGWTEKQGQDYDYGAIVLPEDCRLGDQVGWFGYTNFSDARLESKMANLSGYPGDKPSGTQWFHARRLLSVSATRLVYDIDTAGGQSGAPVWFLMGGKRYGIGIHTTGSVTGNSATRINEPVFQNLNLWKAAGG